jgi:hypothetical protein
MYTLRKIAENGVEFNISLGDNYCLIHSERNSEEFEKSFEDFWKEKHDPYKNETYAFVCKNGYELIPIFKKDFNFIMTDSGKTFSNLTYK